MGRSLVADRVQIVGTPEDCLQQIAELQRLTGTDHLVTEFSYGRIPHADGDKQMRLFAKHVLPVLGTATSDLFAPA